MDGSDFSPRHMCKTSEKGRPSTWVGNGMCVVCPRHRDFGVKYKGKWDQSGGGGEGLDFLL